MLRLHNFKEESEVSVGTQHRPLLFYWSNEEMKLIYFPHRESYPRCLQYYKVYCKVMINRKFYIVFTETLSIYTFFPKLKARSSNFRSLLYLFYYMRVLNIVSLVYHNLKIDY